MITTEQVKELRDKTGVSVMQCRKALEEAEGDMEKATVILRKKGSEVAEKKSDRTASDGRITIKAEGGKAVVVILSCETDFVAQNDDFKTLSENIMSVAWNEGADTAKAQAAVLINDVVLKIGENIQLVAVEEIHGETIGIYTHYNGKSGAVVALTGGTSEVAKDIAMHAAAMKPRYMNAGEITDKERAEVTEVLEKEVTESDKPADIKAKMLEGKLKTYFSEQTLSGQPFFKDPSLTIDQYATKNGGVITTAKVYIIG